VCQEKTGGEKRVEKTGFNLERVTEHCAEYFARSGGQHRPPYVHRIMDVIADLSENPHPYQQAKATTLLRSVEQ
jgi:hypothetical protein